MDQRDEDALLDMFASRGWRLFISEIEDAHRTLVETAWTVSTLEELQKRKGEIEKLGSILSYERVIKMEAKQDAEVI